MANVIAFRSFLKYAKRFSKQFYSLPGEIERLVTSLENNPKQGTPLGGGFYKIRLASKSKGTGKSGGFRVVTYYLNKTKEGETL